MFNLNYITDISGNQIAVQIPINDWLVFQKGIPRNQAQIRNTSRYKRCLERGTPSKERKKKTSILHRIFK